MDLQILHSIEVLYGIESKCGESLVVLQSNIREVSKNKTHNKLSILSHPKWDMTKMRSKYVYPYIAIIVHGNFCDLKILYENNICFKCIELNCFQIHFESLITR